MSARDAEDHARPGLYPPHDATTACSLATRRRRGAVLPGRLLWSATGIALLVLALFRSPDTSSESRGRRCATALDYLAPAFPPSRGGENGGPAGAAWGPPLQGGHPVGQVAFGRQARTTTTGWPRHPGSSPISAPASSPHIYAPLGVAPTLTIGWPTRPRCATFAGEAGLNVFLYEERPRPSSRRAARPVCFGSGPPGRRRPRAAGLTRYLWSSTWPLAPGRSARWSDRLRSTGLGSARVAPRPGLNPQRAFGPRVSRSSTRRGRADGRRQGRAGGIRDLGPERQRPPSGRGSGSEKLTRSYARLLPEKIALL